MAYNFNECKDGNPTKDKARQLTMDMLKELLTNALGADNVTQTANNMFGVHIGDKQVGNENCEVCVTIEVVAKDYTPRVANSGKVFPVYERLIEGDNYQTEVEKNKAKEEQAEREKAERAEKLKAEKERKKAEKEERARAKLSAIAENE